MQRGVEDHDVEKAVVQEEDWREVMFPVVDVVPGERVQGVGSDVQAGMVRVVAQQRVHVQVAVVDEVGDGPLVLLCDGGADDVDRVAKVVRARDGVRPAAVEAEVELWFM